MKRYLPDPVIENLQRQMPLPERALRWAAHCRDLGVRETGSNRGAWVKRFLASARLGEGYAWCAAFMNWCLLKAGAERKGLPSRPAAVNAWHNWAHAKGYLCKPKRGALFYWLNENWTGHIGIIAEVTPTGRLRTIEGNTDAQGSREGDGVHERVRTLRELEGRHIHGFIDLDKLKTAVAPWVEPV